MSETPAGEHSGDYDARGAGVADDPKGPHFTRGPVMSTGRAEPLRPCETCGHVGPHDQQRGFCRVSGCDCDAPTYAEADHTAEKRAHSCYSFDLTTPRQYTARGGWNAYCACGEHVGESGDDDLNERHQRHIASVIASAETAEGSSDE